MDRYARKQAQLACQISLGLMAGIFSVMPQASAAPIHDASSDLNTGATVTTADKVTTVQGNQTNNVVAWKDFSVASDETVKFNGSTGDTTTRDYNYLNVVTGKNTSQIAGTIEGGKNVYIVNQHGVIIDKDATVNVGNLYVSTKAVNDADTVKNAINNNTESAVLSAATTGTAVSDVVNLGTIQAANVQVDGKNIRFLNSANVQTSDGTVNTNVTLNASGYAHVGNTDGNVAGYTGTVEYYKLVSDATALQNINDNLSGNYMLANTIDASGIDNFTPIGSSSTMPFKGKFDGMFYEVKNLNVSTDGNAGLFGNTSGARIENVGVVGATIAATGASGNAGSIVGKAIDSTIIQNVYSETSVASDNTVKGSVSGELAGGLVGYLKGTLNSSYNTASVNSINGGRAGGLAARLESGSIKDAYNTGTITGDNGSTVSGITYAPSGATVTRVYNTYGGLTLVGGQKSGLTSGKTFGSSDADNAKHISTFVKSGTQTDPADNSWTDDDGKTSAISTDGTDNTTWRLYEGQSTPLLTAFFQGTTTADYSYNYFTKDGTTATSTGLTLAGNTNDPAVNGGADLTGLTYNAQYLKIAAPTTDSSGATVTSTSTSTDADSVKGYVSFGSNVESTDENIDINTAGVKDVAFDGDGNVTAQSLIYSGQHGYNIVGGNVTIGQREVSASTDKTLHITKEYDGTTDATTAIGQQLGGDNVTVGGLLAGDDVALEGLTASYADKNVGTDKTVSYDGSKATLTGTSAANYHLADNAFDGLTITGDITPRTLYVKLNSSGSFDKTYNGTADVENDAASVANNVAIDTNQGDAHQIVTTTDSSGKTTTEDVSINPSSGTIQYYNGDTTVSDSNAATNTDSYTIRYSGITLQGNDAGNYQLVVADATAANGYKVLYDGSTSTSNADTYLTAAGKINQRVIDPTTFQVVKDGKAYSATKTYDGSSSYTLDSGATLQPTGTSSTIANSGVLTDQGESITFALASGATAEFQDDSGNATSQVANAKKLAAKVTATADNAKTNLANYVWGENGKTLTNTDTYDVTTSGSITRRAITVHVTQPSTVSIDKTYDSTTVVNTTKYPAAELFGTDGYVNYTGSSLHLADGTDGTTADNTSLTVTAAYDNANVNRDSSGSVIARNINYTVALTGDNAANYTLNAVDANNKSLGTIDIAKSGESLDLLGEKTGASGIINPLELSSSFGTITKTYDGTTDVPADKLSATLSDGIYDADKGKVSLKSGYNAVFQSKNVKGDGTTWKDSNGKVWTNYVNYSGLALEGDNAGNYTIADTATGGGTITPLTLKAGDFEYTFGDITKTYDGNATVNNADAKLLTAKVTATGDYFKQGDTNYTSATATYKDKNSNNAAKQDVNYTVTISNDGSGNYDFSGFTDGKLTDTVTDTNGGTITRRALYASVTNTDPFTKTYDGTTDAGLAAGDASVTLTGDADHADTTGFVSGDGAANESTGAFASADVAYDTTDTDKVAAQNVNYTIKLNSDTAQDNYVVYDATDKTKELAYDTAGVLTGDGIINPATITATFGKITKVYDGTTNVAGTKALDGTTAEKQFTYSLDGVLSPNGTKDDVTISADIANAAYTDANKGIGDRDITYKFTLGGNDLRNYKLSTDTSADGYNKTHAGDYTTTIGGNSIQTKTLTKDDISVAWGNVTKVYDGSKNVAYTHKAEDGYFDGEIGSKTTSDFISTTTDNTTGLKLGGISIAKGTTGYTVSDVALFDSADTDATKATFRFTLSDDVANNFDFSGITDIYDASTRTLTRSTSDDNATASITAKQVKLDFAPLKDHSQVYNGSATLVDNSQTAPAAAAKDLSSTITGVTGLVNNEAQSVLGLSVAGAFVDTTTDGTTVRAKDAGTGKSIQYDVTLTNKNYTFYPNGTDVADAMTGTVDTTGKAITYLGTTANGYAGTITPKTLTVKAAKDSLVKTYDGTAAVEDGDLKNITFDGLIAGEDLTPGLATSTNKDGGLSAVYVDSNGNESADVEYDNGVTHKAVKVSGLKNALANATTDTTGKVLVSNYQIADDTQTFSKDDANAVGKINQLSLGADDVTKVWTKNYTREYDGTSAIDPQKVVQLQIDTSKIAGKDGKAYTIAYEGTAIFLKNGSATEEQSDAGKNLGIVVDIKKVDTTAAGNTNFDLSNLKTFNGKYYNYEIEANGGAGVSDGVITPRLLTVTAIKNADFDKTYDGDFYVENPGTKFEIRHLTTDDDGNVTYEKAILDKDASAVEASIGEAYYNSSSTTFAHDKNAAEDKAISVQGTITVKDASSTAANNYTLVLGGKDDPTAVTHTSEVFAKDEDGNLATGTIAKKELHLVDAGNRFDKEYDTDSSVLADQLKDNFTLNSKDFVGNETLTLNYDNLKGSYVQGEATTADEQTAEKANPKSDVNWVDGKGVQDWGVLVYGAQSALADGTNGGLSSNYTIADTVYFKQAAARGQIKPIALTMSNIKEKWTPVTKTYDGTKEIKNVNSLKDPLTLYVDNYTSNAGTTGEKTHASTGTPYAYVMYDLNGTPTYDNKNAGKTHSLSNFVVGGLTDVTDDTAGETVNHNFTLSDDLAAAYKNKTMTSDANNVINRKLIELGLTDTTKVYDGTKTFKGSYEALNGNDKATGDDLSVVVTAAYDSANVDAVDGKTKDDGTKYQNITYGVQLSGNDAENYTLVDGAETTSATGLDAEGHITPRPVYIDFKGDAPRGIDKVYGTTYAGLTPASNGSNLTTVRQQVNPDLGLKDAVVVKDNTTNDKESGIVNDEVELDKDNYNIHYANGNVARVSDGTVTTQDVLFDNVNLAAKAGTDGTTGNTQNYELMYLTPAHTTTNAAGDTVLKGTGTISAKTIRVGYDNATELEKTYNGSSALESEDVTTLEDYLNGQVATGASLLLPTDTLTFDIKDGDAVYTGTTATKTADGTETYHSNETEGVDDGDLGVKAKVTWTSTNDNYDVVFTDKADATQDVTQTDTELSGQDKNFTFSKNVTTTQGTITPKTLTMAGGNASKTYTGTSDIEANLTGEDATGNTNAPITFDGIVDHDKNANSIANLGTAEGTFYKKGTTNAVADANDDEDTDGTVRDIGWTVTLTNKDYRLADDGTMTGTVTGSGVIKRAELTFASDPVQSRFGQTPTFTGTVTGWANGEGDSFDKTSVTWNTAPGTSVRGTSSAPIYGWYRYDDQTGAGTSWSYDTTKTSNGADIYATDGVDGYRNFGNYGKNYTIVQQPGQFTSQADRPDGLDDVLNPARRVRPDMEVYNHVTHDDVGTVIRDPKAGIEYEAGGTSLQTDGSASYNGTMTVEGAGEVVNLTQSGTAASADRVDLTNGSANYTLSGAENVPTADVTVADVTEDVASEANTASATAAAGATSAASTTGADDTTVTDDDDDDAVKAAAESSDDREAEATVEYAGQAPSLFSEAITGTKVAS